MRKHYLDNIKWVTVVIVVIYHVLYMYNAEGILSDPCSYQKDRKGTLKGCGQESIASGAYSHGHSGILILLPGLANG